MKVKDVMHKGVEWVHPDTLVKTLAKTMRERDIGALPVGENDRLIGMVTDRDIAIRSFVNGRDPSTLTAREVMSSRVIWRWDSDSTRDAARLMEGKKVRRLPVIDDNKRMVGMLSLGDISQGEARLLAAEVVRAVSAHHN